MWQSIIRHEIRQKLANPADWLYPLVFFVMIIALFPIAISTQQTILQKIAAPAVWIAALFAILLGTTYLFRQDVENGNLEQIMVSRVSLTLWVMLKLLIHWLSLIIALVLASTLVVPLYGLDTQAMWLMCVSLLVGTPLLVLFSALAAALTTSLSSANALVPLIALPLQLPIVIFATGLLPMQQESIAVMPVLAMMLAMLIFSIMLIPWAIAMALRLSV